MMPLRALIVTGLALSLVVPLLVKGEAAEVPDASRRRRSRPSSESISELILRW